MADLLIKGMDMPTKEEISKCIIVRHDGEVWIVEFDNLVDGGHLARYPATPMRAVPVPPHGSLKDADALMKVMCEGISPSDGNEGFNHPFDILRAIANTPTIIEASEVK